MTSSHLRGLARALAIALALCALSAQAQAAQTGPAAPSVLAVPAVSLAKAQQRELIDLLTVSGTLVPREEVLDPAEIDGLRLVELLADEGDVINAGQVLARLSRDTLDAHSPRTTRPFARPRHRWRRPPTRSRRPRRRRRNPRAPCSVPRRCARRATPPSSCWSSAPRLRGPPPPGSPPRGDGYAVAQAEKAAAEAQRRELMVKLARTEIKAPVGGIISRRTAKVGSVTSLSGEPLFRLIANGKVELEAEVMETSLARLTPNAPASLQLVGGRTLVGSIRLLPAEVDRTTRLGKVRIALPADPAFRVGAFARAQVVLAQHNGVAVPSSAVAYGAAGPSVQVVKDDKVEVRPVTVGITAGGHTEILTGLANGEQVVAKAMAFLRTAMPCVRRRQRGGPVMALNVSAWSIRKPDPGDRAVHRC